MWYCYILQCSDDSYYTGIAKDLKARVIQHNTGHGARYTKGRRPIRLVWQEEHGSRGGATKRERQIKKWTRKRKIQLIEGRQDATLAEETP